MNTDIPLATHASRAARRARLRVFCLLEALTLLALLFVAVPLKHLAAFKLAVTVIGPLHGFVFLAFAWLVVQAVNLGDIEPGTGARLGLAAFVPFGGLFSWRALR